MAKSTVYLDLDEYDDGFEYISLAHEIRHIFQYLAIYKDPELREDIDDDINKWKENFESYDGSSNPKYVDQPLEMDANAFARCISKVIFHRDIVVYAADQKQFELYTQKMIMNYTPEEIMECASYHNLNITLDHYH